MQVRDPLDTRSDAEMTIFVSIFFRDFKDFQGAKSIFEKNAIFNFNS